MISQARILSIFRKIAGTGSLTSTGAELPKSERQLLEDALNGEYPLIARVISPDNWFALTASRLVSNIRGEVRKASITDIKSVAPQRGIDQLSEGKALGGPLDLRLRDGSMVRFVVDDGKAFIALLNICMYIARVNKLGDRDSELSLDNDPSS